MIIGRKREQHLLEKAYSSNEAEFLVIYGRRRVGKTYLIREYFERKKCVFFHTTGLQKGSLNKQLKKFAESISETFFENAPLETPAGWDEAFKILHNQISKLNKKVVIFLDELPWMATRKSGLLEEIDYYWNQRWSRLRNVILIVCGSSASWLIRKVLYNKGGLHNRVTCQIRLLPFSLAETKDFLKSKKIKLNNEHILSLYMALGGVPYYLKYVESGLSAEQNIQRILFDNNAPLKDEFNKLFDSLFRNAQAYIELVKLISQKKEGVSRGDLNLTALLSSTGGSLSRRLQDLNEAGFITEHLSWGSKQGEYYKVIDEFNLFYLRWIGLKKNQIFAQDYWMSQSRSPEYYAWSGYAFEAICVKHIDHIIRTLQINAASTISSWRFVPRKANKSGAQIDLLIDRNDDAITLCEIKYTDEPFAIDKSYAAKINNKIDVFKRETKTKKQIFFSMISANGLKKTLYSEEMIHGVVTLEDLFEQKGQ